MKTKPKHHASGLVNRLVQLHENGTKKLGRVSLLCLEHWQEAERLRERIEELQVENKVLKSLIKE